MIMIFYSERICEKNWILAQSSGVKKPKQKLSFRVLILRMNFRNLVTPTKHRLSFILLLSIQSN
jgi:hypothetical protein